MSPSREELRTAVWETLSQLRKRIRTYLFSLSAARVMILLGLVFWAFYLIDEVYYQLTYFELPIWVRKMLLGAGLGGMIALVVWSLWPLFRHWQNRALALVLERKFPELNDRLITSVEYLQENEPEGSELTRMMLNRTTQEVEQHLQTLELDEVFDRVPLKKTGTTATVLFLSIILFLGLNHSVSARIIDAFVTFAPNYREHNTEFAIKVLAQPGDLIRHFDENHQYKHPRGRDLVLVVAVPENNEQTGESWIVPDRVRIDYRSRGGRGKITLNRTGDREFRYTFTNLIDDMEFEILGGDYRSPEPNQVRIVEPPQVSEIALLCDYPDYTRLDLTDRNGDFLPEELMVDGTQISIPQETRFQLRCRANKPLVRVTLQTDQFEVTLEKETAALTRINEAGGEQENWTLPVGKDMGLQEEPSGFHLPLWLNSQLSEQPGDQLPIELGPDALVRLTLEDIDGVISDQPTRLTINGIEDQAPVIESELQGISSSITRKAVIPVTGTITDDYGISRARFEFKVGEEEEWQSRLFRNAPANAPRQFKLKRAEEEPFEQFEVMPLDLSVGQNLTLVVYAADGDNLNGPHETRSQLYQFQIVSAQELLGLLYTKELNLRRRFERIIEELEKTERDLVLTRTQLQDRAKLSTEGEESLQKRELLSRSLAIAAQRSLFQVRKNRSELRAVEEAFGNLLKESVNNGVHTSQMVTRIEDLIVRPLQNVHETEIPELDQQLGLFKLALEKNEPGERELLASSQRLARILSQLKAVLQEMRDLLEFHEALQDLKNLIDDQKKLRDETENEQKDKLIDSLKSLGIE